MVRGSYCQQVMTFFFFLVFDLQLRRLKLYAIPEWNNDYTYVLKGTKPVLVIVCTIHKII